MISWALSIGLALRGYWCFGLLETCMVWILMGTYIVSEVYLLAFWNCFLLWLLFDV